MSLQTCRSCSAAQEAEAERRDREEEHRLVHVALTRAKERLYLTVLKNQSDFNTWQKHPAKPAHFLQNLSDMEPVALKVRERTTSSVLCGNIRALATP